MQTTILLLKVNPRPAEKCYIFLLEGMARQLKQLLDTLLTRHLAACAHFEGRRRSKGTEVVVQFVLQL